MSRNAAIKANSEALLRWVGQVSFEATWNARKRGLTSRFCSLRQSEKLEQEAVPLSWNYHNLLEPSIRAKNQVRTVHSVRCSAHWKSHWEVIVLESQRPIISEEQGVVKTTLTVSQTLLIFFYRQAKWIDWRFLNKNLKAPLFNSKCLIIFIFIIVIYSIPIKYVKLFLIVAHAKLFMIVHELVFLSLAWKQRHKMKDDIYRVAERADLDGNR